MFKTELENQLINNAKLAGKTIVLPEAGYSKEVFEAGILAAKSLVAKVVFLVKDYNELNKFNYTKTEGVTVVNMSEYENYEALLSELLIKRKSKGLTEVDAKKLLLNEIYFATLMVELGYADGMVCGAVNTTADSMRPALQIIKGKSPSSIISSFFLMISDKKEFGHNGVYFLADCGLNENPNSHELSEITFDTVSSARALTNIDPKVALLTYSTLGSANGTHPEKMREVKDLVLSKNPDFLIDGEFQFDTAIIKSVADKKAKNSSLNGNANILIFPDLSSGNISYKIMQRLAGFTAIGPICQGFNKPINDISRGASSLDILLIIAITCLQAV